MLDLTASHRAAVVNGVVWNLLNLAIVGALLRRQGRARMAHHEPEPAGGVP